MYPSRPFNRQIITRPDSGVLCSCRAIAGYRLTSGSRTVYACPACASHYDNAEWQSEMLPHIARQHEQMLFDAYVLHRDNGFSPGQIARDFRATFEGRVESLESRYQAEAGKRAAS